MRNLIAGLLLMVSYAAYGQGNPPPFAAYVNSGGSWTPATTSYAQGAINMPPPVALYCLNTGTNQWVPATSACLGGGGGSGVTWPASGDIVISNGTDSPNGLAPVNGDCVVGSGGAWTAGSCGGSAAFSALTSGTNTGAAMVVGTGASLTASGTGSIGATTILGGLANDLPYQAGAGTTGFIAPVDNAVLTTGAGGVPAESTTLPSGLTIPGYANCTAGTSGSDCLQLSSGLVPVGNLPVATTSALGVVQPDGTIITDTSGVITVAKASSSAFGVVECGSGTTCTSGVISVSASSGCMTPITTTLVSASATIDISSIPATCTVLHITGFFGATSGTINPVELTFNGETPGGTSHYTNQFSQGIGTTGSTGLNGSGYFNAENEILSGNVGGFYASVLDYASTTLQKVIVETGFGNNSTPTTQNQSGGGQWTQTAAINEVTLTASSSTFPAGSFMRITGE